MIYSADDDIVMEVCVEEGRDLTKPKEKKKCQVSPFLRF